MPDSFTTTGRAPGDWSDAFAALPLESPAGDGWPRIARAMDASRRRGHRVRERRTTWLVGLASAAVLVMAAWSPLMHWLQGSPAASKPPMVATTAAPGAREPAVTRQIPAGSLPQATPTAPLSGASAKPVLASTSGHDDDTMPPPARGSRAHHARKAAQPPQHIAQRAAHARPQGATPAATDRIAAAPTATATGAVQSLQAQSARLEALVAAARDERVGNASSELLSAEVDAGIAAVDASLSHDDLDDSRRQQLWQQRVDLLQQLAGIETTARWLAAQGMSNETALVSVD